MMLKNACRRACGWLRAETAANRLPDPPEHATELTIALMVAHLLFSKAYWMPAGLQITRMHELLLIAKRMAEAAGGGTFLQRFLTHVKAAALIYAWEACCYPHTYWNFTKANTRLLWNAAVDGHPLKGLCAAITAQLFWYGHWKTSTETPKE